MAANRKPIGSFWTPNLGLMRQIKVGLESYRLQQWTLDSGNWDVQGSHSALSSLCRLKDVIIFFAL